MLLTLAEFDLQVAVEGFIENYGLLSVAVLLLLSGIGLALGEEMVTLPAGVLIATGKLDFATTAIVAYVSIVIADMMWFGICRHFGTPLLHRRWAKRLIHPRRLLEAKHQLELRGAWIVVMARFIPSSRSTTITVAGMLHMPFWKFAAATASCTLLTVPIQLGFGYLIGRGSTTEDLPDLIFRIVGVVMILLAVTLTLSLFYRHRASRQRPRRAKAKWLREHRQQPSTASSPELRLVSGDHARQSVAAAASESSADHAEDDEDDDEASTMRMNASPPTSFRSASG